MNDISIKKAAILNALAKYSTVILQIVYITILSRILTPKEFGIVAIINVFTAFFQLIADMGFGAAVVQKKDLQKEEINEIFSFSIYTGLFLFAIFMLLSYPISLFYNDKIYIPLGIILSFAILLNSWNMIPNAMMLREKNFKAIALRTVIVSIISFGLTILLALMNFGVYALAFHSCFTAAGLFLWNQLSAKLKFTFKPSLKTIKKIWGYSFYQFSAQAINYFNRNLDTILMGKFFTKAELGYYNKSYTLTQYPIQYLPGVITPVLHPFLSEHQNDKAYIYKKYIGLLKLLSLLGVIGSCIFFFTAEEIIYIAFGPQWQDSIFPFKILSLSLWSQILTNTIAPIYQSIGNTKLMFKTICCSAAIILSATVFGVIQKSVACVAIAISIAYILNFFVVFYALVKKGLEQKFFSFLSTFISDAFIFTILILCSFVWTWQIKDIFVSFILKSVYLCSIYVILLLIFKKHHSILDFIKSK